MVNLEEAARHSYQIARRIVVSVIGGTLLLLGAILLFTPGPALVVIPAGLGVLALEYSWARRWLRQLRAAGSELGRTTERDADSGRSREETSKG